ncbi:hypothetical protein BD779DRAFT_1666145 [Infundibulicybe gibba]|nr:hypothetical protein BD779DRAFT_1666145 [Infundibulicybe gibba]
MEPDQKPPATPLLVTQILGFPPQLLLNDVTNIANNAVQDARMGGEWDGTQEIKRGLGMLETRLKHHADVELESFEAWSLRHLFFVPADLPIVLPQHENLDLTQMPEIEEIMDDIEPLREELDTQRQLKRLLTPAYATSERRRHHAEQRRKHLSFLEGPALEILRTLPDKLLPMYQSLLSLPKLEPVTVMAPEQLRMSEPGKRQWETKQGYLDWAVSRLLAKAGGDGADSKDEWVGEVQQLKAALDAVNADLENPSP